MTRTIILLTLSLAALLLVAPPATAQQSDEVRPGAAVIDTTPLRSGIDSVAVYIVDEDGAVPVGRFIRETVVGDGRVTREDRFYGIEGEYVWTERFSVEDGTLRPLVIEIGGMRPQAMRFVSERVERVREVEGAQDVVRAELALPLFQVNTLDFVLPSLPLAPGYRATLLALNDDDLTERRIEIEVEREVGVHQVGGELRNTWEVHVDIGGATDIYHVDQTFGVIVRYESAADGVVMLRW